MAFTLVTTQTILARNAGALYNLELGSTTMNSLVAQTAAAGGIDAFLNAVYNSSVGATATTVVAAELVENLGFTDATLKAQAEAIIVANLNAVPSTGRGAVINNILSTFSTLTADATWGASATAFNTKVANAEAYAAVAANTTNQSFDSTSGTTTVGQTFTLTTGVDNIAGTAGDDTIIADNTGVTKTLSVADQLNGGAGTDTLKVYLAAADTATGQPTLTSIEEVYINGGAVVAYTAATGTTKLSIDAPVVNTAATYTVNGQSVSLANHNVTAATTTTIAQAAAATATTQDITLNGVKGTAAVHTIDASGAKITTLNVTGTGASSSVTLANTGAGIKTLNISGDKAVTITEDAATAAAITTVAVTNTAGATVDTSAAAVAATFKFTGGEGNDTVKFANNGLANLTSGAQLDGGAGTSDKLALLDAALDATETARINQAVGFEVLGLNAAITLDASTLTSIKSFSIDTTALTQTISNMATGSTTTITAAAPTSLTLGTNVGVTDTSVVLGESTSAGIAVAALVTTGITNVTVTSNGTAANAITALTNSDNSLFTINGAQDLTLSLAAGTAVGSKIDASAFTGKATLTGSALAASGDVIIGGTGADTIDGGKGADTLTGGAGADTFKFTSAAAANASGATFGQADVITDFVIGTDKLQFTTVDVVSGQQGAVQTAVTALAAGSTDAQIATAMATANTTNLGVSFAVFGGNTYALYETTGASTGVAADDVFIKLAGVTTLPTFAADVIA
jgi:hypothetical protein